MNLCICVAPQHCSCSIRKCLPDPPQWKLFREAVLLWSDPHSGNCSGKLCFFGQPPIDHIDRDGTNNKWENLRDVTQEENNKNKSPYKKRNLR